MDATTKFELLKKFFEEQQQKKLSADGYKKDTGIGRFVPSDLTILNAGIEQLITQGVIDTLGWFLHAGGGDGRGVALTNGVYRIPSIYVEYDRQLVALTEDNIEQLQRLELLDGTPIIITRGNFLRNKTYHKIGIKFEDIATIFNYFDNHMTLAAKIAKQSKPGTVFILEVPLFPYVRFEGLKFVQDLALSNERGVQRYLCVYRK